MSSENYWQSLRDEFIEWTAEENESCSDESHSSSTIRDAITNTDANARVYKDTEHGQPLSTNLDDSTNKSLGLEIAANLNSSEDGSLDEEYHHLEQGWKDNDLGTEKDAERDDTLDLHSLPGQLSDEVPHESAHQQVVRTEITHVDIDDAYKHGAREPNTLHSNPMRRDGWMHRNRLSGKYSKANNAHGDITSSDKEDGIRTSPSDPDLNVSFGSPKSMTMPSVDSSVSTSPVEWI
mgnify:CR=1 FL=1